MPDFREDFLFSCCRDSSIVSVSHSSKNAGWISSMKGRNSMILVFSSRLGHRYQQNRILVSLLSNTFWLRCHFLVRTYSALGFAILRYIHVGLSPSRVTPSTSWYILARLGISFLLKLERKAGSILITLSSANISGFSRWLDVPITNHR